MRTLLFPIPMAYASKAPTSATLTLGFSGKPTNHVSGPSMNRSIWTVLS